MISHGHGVVTQYSHLSSFKVQAGDRIKKGEVIGGMGNTGRSTGPHLHYEVHLNGVPVNPEKYM
jgi:murein DD-endopeptidase MepM/ murein hydrolase activator NlpD